MTQAMLCSTGGMEIGRRYRERGGRQVMLLNFEEENRDEKGEVEVEYSAPMLRSMREREGVR
jgi:hypothetical protein